MSYVLPLPLDRLSLSFAIAILIALASASDVLAQDVSPLRLFEKELTEVIARTEKSVVSIARHAVPDGPVVVGRLGVLDGCLAISPGTLVAVNPPMWQWDALRGALTWIASSSSEPFRIGDDLRVAGTLVPASQLRADGVELPTSCADFAGDVLLLGSPVPRTDDAPALPRLGTGGTSSPQG